MGQEKAMSRITILVILLLVILIVGGIYFFYFRGKNVIPGLSTQKTVDKAQVTVGLHGDITGIYPKSEDEEISFEVNRHIFDPLVSLDKNMKIVSGLAESWTNPDDTTWRFKLRKNTKFHDGSSFTSNDVKFTLDEAIKNEWSSSAYLASVDSVNIIDDYTFDIKTISPDPVLLNELANVLILSKNYKATDTEPNGTGPYKFVEWTEGDHITLTENSNYFAGAPKVKKAIFKIIEDEKARVKALLAGQVDLILYGFEEDATSEIQANSNLQVKNTSSLGVSLLVLNQSLDLFKNIKVRQAIYKGINVNEIIAQAISGGEPASQFVTKAVFGYNPDVRRPDLEIAEAKKLLADAGYPNGFEVTIDDIVGNEKIDQAIIQQLANIGIKAKLNALERDAAQKVLAEKTSQILRMSWSSDTGDSADGLNGLLHTPDDQGIYGFVNFGYSNKSVDAAIEDAGKTLNQKQRLQYLQSAMKQAMDDVALIPLYTPNFKFGIVKDIKWEPRPNRQIYVFEMAGLSK